MDAHHKANHIRASVKLANTIYLLHDGLKLKLTKAQALDLLLNRDNRYRIEQQITTFMTIEAAAPLVHCDTEYWAWHEPSIFDSLDWEIKHVALTSDAAAKWGAEHGIKRNGVVRGESFKMTLKDINKVLEAGVIELPKA